MKTKIPNLILLFSVAVLICGCGVKKTKSSGLPADEYDVYLLIGQSNMAGRGTMIPADTAVIEGVFLLDSLGNIIPARNPLNLHSSVRKSVREQQIGPAFIFSKTMHEKTGRNILLVVNAKGGTGLNSWLKGASQGYYSEAVRRAKQAQEYGEIKAILWHQGENNSANPDDYLVKLKGMVSDLRQDLGLTAEDVPFIAGEIAPWHRNREIFNPVIHQVSDSIPNASWVSSEGAGMLRGESDPHFSRDGQLLMGKRYAEKVLEMTGR